MTEQYNMTETIREVKECRLFAGTLQAKGLYNVSYQPLLDKTSKYGTGKWFSPHFVPQLKLMSEEKFEKQVKILVARELWEDLGNTPVDDDGIIEEPVNFEIVSFETGTGRETIWHWFEEYFNLSVAEDLMFPNTPE